jgi:hypothetical protein
LAVSTAKFGFLREDFCSQTGAVENVLFSVIS